MTFAGVEWHGFLSLFDFPLSLWKWEERRWQNGGFFSHPPHLPLFMNLPSAKGQEVIRALFCPLRDGGSW